MVNHHAYDFVLYDHIVRNNDQLKIRRRIDVGFHFYARSNDALMPGALPIDAAQKHSR